MNDRKQHVIKLAHQLFIEKGFQSTSIQDILEYSGISKGTFYNYFSSKNELLMAIFHSVQEKLEIERNKLLIGKERSNIDIFIKQLELQIKLNKQSKLFALFEEVFVSNDVDFKDFLKKAQSSQLNWTFHRLVDIFGESKRPYLLDCTIMFTGMLHHYFHYFFKQKQPGLTIHQVIRYCMNRLSNMVEEVASNGDQLYDPELMAAWFPTSNDDLRNFRNTLEQSINDLKIMIRKDLHVEQQQLKWIELLDFVQEEMLQSRHPRHYLVESALDSLANEKAEPISKEYNRLRKFIHAYFSQANL